MTTTVDVRCVVCGDDRELQMGSIEVDEPGLRPSWKEVPRCIDRDACRQRAFDLIEREGKP